jgi:hypothetical protein
MGIKTVVQQYKNTASSNINSTILHTIFKKWIRTPLPQIRGTKPLKSLHPSQG